MNTFRYIMELPEGYEFRFIEVEGETKLFGIREDKNPILIEQNKKGEFEIKEITPCQTT